MRLTPKTFKFETTVYCYSSTVSKERHIKAVFTLYSWFNLVITLLEWANAVLARRV